MTHSNRTNLASGKAHVVLVDRLLKTAEQSLGEGWSVLLVNETGRNVPVEGGVIPDGEVPDHWDNGDRLRAMLCRAGRVVGMMEEVRLERIPGGGFKVLVLSRTFSEYRASLTGRRESDEKGLWVPLTQAWSSTPPLARWLLGAVAGAIVAGLVTQLGLA